MKITRGSTQTDQLSGFTGMVTGVANFLTGCTRIELTPKEINKDGKPAESQWFDEMRLMPAEWAEHVAQPEPVTTGGPREAPTRAGDAR